MSIRAHAEGCAHCTSQCARRIGEEHDGLLGSGSRHSSSSVRNYRQILCGIRKAGGAILTKRRASLPPGWSERRAELPQQPERIVNESAVGDFALLDPKEIG